VEGGDGKNKSVATSPAPPQTHFFCHSLSSYILIVPQQDFLLISSEKKHAKQSLRSGSSFTSVAYI